MADAKGEPLAAELVPSPPAHAPAKGGDKPPPCVACKGVHGGVGAGILCLEQTVIRQRALLLWQQGKLDAIAELVGRVRT